MSPPPNDLLLEGLRALKRERMKTATQPLEGKWSRKTGAMTPALAEAQRRLAHAKEIDDAIAFFERGGARPYTCVFAERCLCDCHRGRVSDTKP